MPIPREPVVDRAWYLAGPMSGLPKFNYPTFLEASHKLRNVHGLRIISPAEQDSYEKFALIMNSEDGDLSKLPEVGTWADFLAHDVKLISEQVTGIIFLPNWAKSKGAKLEAYIGLLHGHDFAYFDVDIGLIEMTREDVLEAIYGALI